MVFGKIWTMGTGIDIPSLVGLQIVAGDSPGVAGIETIGIHQKLPVFADHHPIIDGGTSRSIYQLRRLGYVLLVRTSHVTSTTPTLGKIQGFFRSHK